MRVVHEVSCQYNMERGSVVDYQCDKFKNIEGNELSFFVVCFIQKGALFYFLGEIDVPPESQFDRVSSCSVKAAISKGRRSWRSTYDVGDGCLPENTQIRLLLVLEEFNLLPY